MLLRWHVNINIIILNVTNIILNPNLNTSSSSHASSPYSAVVHSAKRISRNSHPRYSCTYSHFKWASDFQPCWHGVNININLNVTNIILNPNLNASSLSHASSPYSAVVHWVSSNHMIDDSSTPTLLLTLTPTTTPTLLILLILILFFFLFSTILLSSPV